MCSTVLLNRAGAEHILVAREDPCRSNTRTHSAGPGFHVGAAWFSRSANPLRATHSNSATPQLGGRLSQPKPDGGAGAVEFVSAGGSDERGKRYLRANRSQRACDATATTPRSAIARMRQPWQTRVPSMSALQRQNAARSRSTPAPSLSHPFEAARCLLTTETAAPPGDNRASQAPV